MSILGNLLWILLGGLLVFLGYLIGGLILCLTLIGIPFGVQCMKLSILGLVPFGKKVVDSHQPPTALSIIMNIIWILVGGIWIAFVHLVFAVLLGITVVGLPFAKQHIKLTGLAFAPFGKTLRS
ncbi:YccF domain-containing protein [bacterium]|nr:YccF domain-containing protein [bacterium]